jgi:outer membrane protein insertion porin family
VILLKFISNLRWFGGVLLIFVLLGLVLVSQTVMAEQQGPNVMTFEVRGNSHVPEEKVLGAISNSKIGQPISSSNLQLDMQAIMALGYFADVRVKTESLMGGIKVILEVVENPEFKELQLQGLTKMNPNDLRPLFTQKPGEIFNATVFRDDLAKAIRYCKEQKGLLVQYRSSPRIIGQDGIVKLELFELKYGKIIIQGLTKTKDHVVRRELLFKEGDIIDTNVLQKSIIKIMQLRLFDNPEPRFEMTTEPDKVDLILDVKEAVGIGEISPQISWTPTTNEVAGSLVYSTPNLMGLGQSLSLNLNYTATSKNIQFSFVEPWLDSKHTSFQLSMGNTDSTRKSTVFSWFDDPKALYDDYHNPMVYNLGLKQTNLALSFGRPLGIDTTVNLGINFEKNDIANPTEIAPSPGSPGPPYVPPTPGQKAIDPSQPLTFWDNSLMLSAVKNNLEYQDAFYVSGGYQLSGRFKASSNWLGGAYSYQQIGLDAKKFFSLAPGLVWGIHGSADWLFGDYPDYDALYLGGMYKLRGYNNERYSGDPGSIDLIGTQTTLFNTELRYRTPMNKNVELVLFFDAGNVNNAGVNHFKLDYGAGIRYIVPFFGVIGFDCFTNSEGITRAVLIIGETF